MGIHRTMSDIVAKKLYHDKAIILIDARQIGKALL